MKEKNEIQRHDLKDNIMKFALFRIDYLGVADATELQKAFVDHFKGTFEKFATISQNQYDLQISDPESISETLSIPVKEIREQKIFRFSQNTFGIENKLTLDISTYFTTLNIECYKYKSIDEYLNFFIELIKCFKARNSYLDIRRIGLRKVGGSVFFNINEITNKFESNYFDFVTTSISGSSLKSALHTDVLHFEKGPDVNFTRSFDLGTYRDKEGKDVEAYQVKLDLDGYFSSDSCEQDMVKMKKQLTELNNKHLFNLYKESVTKEFLNSSLNV